MLTAGPTVLHPANLQGVSRDGLPIGPWGVIVGATLCQPKDRTLNRVTHPPLHNHLRLVACMGCGYRWPYVETAERQGRPWVISRRILLRERIEGRQRQGGVGVFCCGRSCCLSSLFGPSPARPYQGRLAFQGCKPYQLTHRQYREHRCPRRIAKGHRVSVSGERRLPCNKMM